MLFNILFMSIPAKLMERHLATTIGGSRGGRRRDLDDEISGRRPEARPAVIRLQPDTLETAVMD